MAESFFKGKTKRMFELTQTERARLEKYDREKRLRPFVARLTGAIMTWLANTPFEDWPTSARFAFKHVSQAAELDADEYKANLPKARQNARPKKPV